MKTNLENRIFKAILENINSIGKKNSNAIFEKGDRCPIFTIQATRLSKEYDEEESDEDMRYTNQTYYNEQRAIDAARDMADDLTDENDVILISVFAGEEEDLEGNVWGECFDIFTISNQDEESTIRARKAFGYADPTVNEYAQ